MKVYISMDAEGISGIFKLGQVMSSDKEYEFARRMMANDVNAAVRGAFNAGAEQVVVNDAHNNGDNLLIDQLDERVDLISGALRPLGMAEGAELGFDAAFLIGYHRRKGGKGVASHSYAYGTMVEMKINGRIAAEFDLIGYCLGEFDIPVIFVSGDDLTIEDAGKSVPGIYSVETKIAISNNAALCHHPKRNAANIERTVCDALQNYTGKLKPMKINGKAEIEVRYSAEVQAANAAKAPNAIREGECTVKYVGVSYIEAYKSFMIGTSLAAAFRDDADLYKG